MGKDGPLTEKLLCMGWNPVRVSLPSLTLVNWTEIVLLLPAATCPKETAEGCAVSCTAFIPVPASVNWRVRLDALLVIYTVPPFQPVWVGANCTVRLVLCPDPSTTGRERPGTLKAPLPTMRTDEIVTEVVPVLVTPTICCSELPKETSANLRCPVEVTSC